MTIRSSLRSVERRVVKMGTTFWCGCPWYMEVTPEELPGTPDQCPRCGKQWTIVCVHPPPGERRA